MSTFPNNQNKSESKKNYYIVGGLIAIIVVLIGLGKSNQSNEQNKSITPTEMFEDSFKQQKADGKIEENIEHYDSITNIYSNFKYHVAFDAPNNWSTDSGVSEHTIFRAYQRDSAISFAINVIEGNLSEKSEENPNIWNLYLIDHERMDYTYKVLIPQQFNSEVENFKATKSYLKNQLSLKRSFSYMVRELDFEYSNTSIVYQTILDNKVYTFGLDVPTMFYEQNSDYYEGLFLNIYFLLNKEEFNNFLNN